MMTREMKRNESIAKHAPLMLRLADTALEALRALMAAERVAKAEMTDDNALFGDDECSIEDAERALVIIRSTAFDAIRDQKEEDANV